MSNLRNTLEEMEKLFGEKIEDMVVGQHYKRESKYTGNDKPLTDENIIISRARGLKKIDQEYDSGYGGADCFPLYAWTKSRVFFISEYDGSTCVSYVPRNPVIIAPEFSGQSPTLDMIIKAKVKS